MPYIDTHSIAVDAPAEVVWDAIAGTLPWVGFRVARAERPTLISLTGAHWFARYELRFVLTPGTVAAESWASFPGVHGRVYRALVNGTRIHVVAVRTLLARIKRSAERAR